MLFTIYISYIWSFCHSFVYFRYYLLLIKKLSFKFILNLVFINLFIFAHYLYYYFYFNDAACFLLYASYIFGHFFLIWLWSLLLSFYEEFVCNSFISSYGKYSSVVNYRNPSRAFYFSMTLIKCSLLSLVYYCFNFKTVTSYISLDKTNIISKTSIQKKQVLWRK